MSAEQKQPIGKRGEMSLKDINDIFEDMHTYAQPIPNEVLHVETEINGKRYKGVLYPVEEQAQKPPVARVDKKLIGRW